MNTYSVRQTPEKCTKPPDEIDHNKSRARDTVNGDSLKEFCSIFLNIPQEIRLPIYDELLNKNTARLRIVGAKGGINPSTLSIHSVLRYDASASSEHYVCDSVGKWLRHTVTVKRYAAHEEIPSSAILSTCRIIATEAIPILYRENTLSFDFGSPDPEETSSFAQQPCPEIFTYGPDAWSTTAAPALRFSAFAAFLNVIGPVNAGTITALCFSGPDTDCIANCLSTVTQLIANHVPRLRRLEIYVEGRNIDPQDRWTPDYHHPNLSSPFYGFWRNEALWPLCRVLETFVGRVTWLKEFEYEGQMVYQDLWEDDRGGWRRLKGLEELVKRRAEAENGG